MTAFADHVNREVGMF